MADLAYGEIYHMNAKEARFQIVKTYQQTHSISATARAWRCARQTVRRWVQRFAAEGTEGLADRSRRPRHCPRRTDPALEEAVRRAWEETHYGRLRLALYLRAQGVDLSPHTLRHILRRSVPPQTRKRRKPLYPAHWAWEEEGASALLLQTDVKDLHDQQALGTARIHHLERAHLPRYQWTACEGRTRLRFLAYSHHLNRTNALAFMILVLQWLRAHGLEAPVIFQTDWGQEFGGDNPARITALAQRFLHPLGGELKRYPLGRKGYNGRVERSHRTDDEEFYRPYLLRMRDPAELLRWAHHWVYFYNALRPHLGRGMEHKPPLTRWQEQGYPGAATIAAMPPPLLDDISADLLLACDPETGNNLLAHYNCPCAEALRD